MKNVYGLLVLVVFFVLGFTACNTRVEDSIVNDEPAEKKGYLLLDGHEPMDATFGIYSRSDIFIGDSLCPFSLSIYGGIKLDDFRYITCNGGDVQSDVIVASMFALIPIDSSWAPGTFTITKMEEMTSSAFEIYHSDVQFIPEGTDSEAEVLPEGCERYVIVSGTMHVELDNDIYTISVNGTLSNDKPFECYYKGVLTDLDDIEINFGDS